MKSKLYGKSIYSISHLKCPRCHQGNLFISRNPYQLKYMLDMPDKCNICRQDFRFEPGFYSAALWISYPIVLVFILIICIILVAVLKISIVFSIIIMACILFLLQPLIMRYSRAILLNSFISYEAKFDPKK